jgi:hypothetical protein
MDFVTKPKILDRLKNFSLPDELNRFAENVDPPTAFYPQLNFSLLIQAVLFYNTSR